MPVARRPLPRVKPAITSSCRRFSFSLRQSGERRPGRYGESTVFATTPSSPCSRAARSSAAPSSNDGREQHAVDGGVQQVLERLPPLQVRCDRRAARRPLEHVEGDEDEAAGALLQQTEAGAPCLVEGADLAVENRRR